MRFPLPFTPGMHMLQRNSFCFGEMGNFVVRTIHIEMSFQCLVKQFHFLICSSTSFQVGSCSFSFQSTAKRHSKLQRPIHSLSNLPGAVCNPSQGCYSAIDGTCRISSPALLVFVTKIHARAFQQSIPCVNHLPICHHSFLTCLFQSWKDDVWYL